MYCPFCFSCACVRINMVKKSNVYYRRMLEFSNLLKIDSVFLYI